MNLQELFEACDYETRSYSGRGMYGRSCLGVDLDRGDSTLSCIAHLLDHIAEEGHENWQDELEEFATAIRDSRSDSMGLGTILYFPDIPYIRSKEQEKDRWMNYGLADKEDE